MKCPKCNGATGSTDHERCTTCKGRGEVRVSCDLCGEDATERYNDVPLCANCADEAREIREKGLE